LLSKKKLLSLFGAHVKKLRESRHLTQAELGGRMNRDQQSIGRIESGNVSPSLYFLYELAEALEVSIKELTDFKY